MSYFSSEELDQRYNENITIFTFDKSIKQKNRYFWIVSSRFSKEHGVKNFEVIENKNVLINALKLLDLENKLHNGESTIIKPLDYNYNKISNYKLTGIELISLVENTKFNKDDINLGLDKEFKNTFDNTYIKCVEKNSADKEELIFIRMYMVPLLIILLSSNYFVFSILNNNILEYYICEKSDYLNNLMIF